MLSLNKLLEMAKTDPEKQRILDKAISFFYCERNKDIESFIKNGSRGYDSNAVMLEEKGITRTYFLIDEDSFQETNEILDRAINIIERSQKLVGGRIIIVECENKDSLLEFYEEHGFESLQVNNSNGLLQLIRNYYKWKKFKVLW